MLQDLGHKVIAGIPSRDFSTHYGLNDKQPVEELQRLQTIERRMLDAQPEQRAQYFEALTAFASQLHSIIRRVSQEGAPDRPLSEIEGVQEILPRVQQPQASGRGPAAAARGMASLSSSAAAGGRAQAADSQVDDRAIASLLDMGCVAVLFSVECSPLTSLFAADSPLQTRERP